MSYLTISDDLRFHLENEICLCDSVFRIGSESYYNLINEVRGLYESGMIELNEDDTFLVLMETGRTGIITIPK